MEKTIRLLFYFIFFIFFIPISFAQVTVIHTENFEASDLTGYAVGNGDTNTDYGSQVLGGTASDYIKRGPIGNFSFDPLSGTTGNFIGLEDVNGAGLGYNGHSYIELDPINIAGKASLTIDISVAFPDALANRYEATKFLIVDYKIDGGAYQKALAFYGNTSGPGMIRDTNLDGSIGGGENATVHNAMTTFTSLPVSGTGTTIEIRVRFNSPDSHEEMAFDNIILKGVNSSTAPTVTTSTAGSVSNTSATLGGNVTADGGATVTERGIVYSTSDTTPTILEGATKDANGSGTGVFSKSISGLAAGTQYYFNAYAINSQGTSYGTQSSFTTTGKGWTGTTSTDWATASNWSPAVIPLASDNLVIPNVTNKPIIGSGTSAVANSVTIDISSTLNISAGGSLTINGNLTQNGTFTINSDATTNGSLIVKGTATGNVTYKRYLTTSGVNAEGWHLIGAPVNGQSINSFSASFITSGVKKAITPYVNNVVSASRWNYYTTDGTNPITSAGNFLKAKGYSAKIGTAGTLDFTGTLNVNNAGETIAITDGGDNPAGNRWNLIANPYTAAINGSTLASTNNFLKINNDANNLDPARGGLYLWNGSSPYVIKSVDDPAFYIAPGQAFFVHAPNGGGTTAMFTEDMQTHQTGNIFLKSNTNYPEIILQISEGANNSSTKIRYIQNKTTGLDVGSDVGTFNGVSSNFRVFSHLLSNSEGIDFAIQALPNSNYENMIVPIGVNAEAGKEITFSLNASNFAADIKIFLEDRTTNTFTQLNQTNSTYKVTLKEALSGIGRFYMHTTNSSLSIDNNLFLENISIYKLDNSTLRIAGLSEKNASLKLFTLLGKQVMSTSFKSTSVQDITIPKLATGVYVVKLQTDKGNLSKKIILE